MCSLLHLHQTSIVEMVFTTAPDPQAYILQVLPSSSNVFNGYNQPAVIMVMDSCSMRIYLLLIFLLIHCTPYVNSIFPLFYLIFSNPSIKHFQAHFPRILIQKGVYFEQSLCHRVFDHIVRSAYTGIYHFIIFLLNVCQK